MSPSVAAPHVPGFLAYASFRRFTVAEYHRMIRDGILATGEPFELLEGYMVHKVPHGTPHDSAMDALEGLLPGLLPPDWFVRCQRAVTLDDSEPEPDHAVVRGPADIGLLVEFADSSLRIDRTDKARVYARAGVAVYWIVNIVDRQIEVYTKPTGAGEQAHYATRTDYPDTAAVPLVLDGVTVGSIAVAEVVG